MQRRCACRAQKVYIGGHLGKSTAGHLARHIVKVRFTDTHDISMRAPCTAPSTGQAAGEHLDGDKPMADLPLLAHSLLCVLPAA